MIITRFVDFLHAAGWPHQSEPPPPEQSGGVSGGVYGGGVVMAEQHNSSTSHHSSKNATKALSPIDVVIDELHAQCDELASRCGLSLSLSLSSFSPSSLH